MRKQPKANKTCIFPCNAGYLCPVMNLADVVYGVRNGEVEREIPVLARGKNQ